MKNIIKSVLCVVLLAVMMLSFTSCGDEHFGCFSYNGKWLTQYADEQLDYNNFLTLIQNFTNKVTIDTSEVPVVNLSVVGDSFVQTQLEYPELPDDIRKSITDKYGTLKVSTRYYEEDNDDATIYPGEYSGGLFTDFLKKNEYSLFAGVTAKNLILFDGIVAYMEEANKVFTTTTIGDGVPFSNIFSYHVDEDGNPVIQIHDFAELPSSVAGGVSSHYRQDIEMVYDSEGKLVKWQSSLGVYTQTSQGTMKQGYILEMDFEWIEKQ